LFCTAAQGTRISTLSGINEGEGDMPWCSTLGVEASPVLDVVRIVGVMKDCGFGA
jgi:hypothetical protein